MGNGEIYNFGPKIFESRCVITSIFHCSNCGKAIFREEDLIEKINLWDLTEYQADCYAIRRAIDPDSFRRYDASLHEGWYCCRFIMMRMIVDKFGTGNQLLVYSDSVTEVQEGMPVPKQSNHNHQIKLGRHDFESVLYHPDAAGLQDKLLIAKLGAIWCPPCRLMDQVIERIKVSNDLPNVEFFEVDIDEEHEIASSWRNQSIPFFLFFYNGRQLKIHSSKFPVVDGGIVGAILEEQLRSLIQVLLFQSKQGNHMVHI